MNVRKILIVFGLISVGFVAAPPKACESGRRGVLRATGAFAALKIHLLSAGYIEKNCSSCYEAQKFLREVVITISKALLKRMMEPMNEAQRAQTQALARWLCWGKAKQLSKLLEDRLKISEEIFNSVHFVFNLSQALEDSGSNHETEGADISSLAHDLAIGFVGDPLETLLYSDELTGFYNRIMDFYRFIIMPGIILDATFFAFFNEGVEALKFLYDRGVLDAESSGDDFEGFSDGALSRYDSEDSGDEDAKAKEGDSSDEDELVDLFKESCRTAAFSSCVLTKGSGSSAFDPVASSAGSRGSASPSADLDWINVDVYARPRLVPVVSVPPPWALHSSASLLGGFAAASAVSSGAWASNSGVSASAGPSFPPRPPWPVSGGAGSGFAFCTQGAILGAGAPPPVPFAVGFLSLKRSLSEVGNRLLERNPSDDDFLDGEFLDGDMQEKRGRTCSETE